MTEIPIRTQPGLAARISSWVRGRKRQLSALVYAAADERARQYGWEIKESTGRFGFGARTYRDPRFDDRRRQLARGAAQAAGLDHSEAESETGR